MIDAKKRGHSIYEVLRTKPFRANVDTICHVFGTPKDELFAIAAREDYNALATFLLNHPNFDYLKECDAQRRGLLDFLISAGNMKTLKLFLSFPASPPCLETLQSHVKANLLQIVAHTGSFKMFKFLIESSFNLSGPSALEKITSRDYRWDTLIHALTKHKRIDMMKVTEHLSLSLPPYNKLTKKTQFLIPFVIEKCGRDKLSIYLNAQDGESETPIFATVRNRDLEIARYLLSFKETDPTIVNSMKQTPFYGLHGNVAMAKVFLEENPHMTKKEKKEFAYASDGYRTFEFFGYTELNDYVHGYFEN